jgi:hypothetical protein
MRGADIDGLRRIEAHITIPIPEGGEGAVEPIVLIHGYSAESAQKTAGAIESIYGWLPRSLAEIYGGKAVVEIDLGRYVSLEDGVTLDDISRALDRALTEDFPHLLRGRFHAVVHSTGALVLRNWIRRFSPKPSPIQNAVYLAGASFGSGWAHIGRGQLAKWARKVFQGGAERGVQVLEALELGSDETIDLHLHFLQAGCSMTSDYKVREFVIVGSQAHVDWFVVPIRYAKEDGSDGVVRVSASDLNYSYLSLCPTAEARRLSWAQALAQRDRHEARRGPRRAFYEIRRQSRPGIAGRPEVPLAIPYRCAHSGPDMGIMTGAKPRQQVLGLLRMALETRGGRSLERVAAFRQQTAQTYRDLLAEKPPPWWRKWIDEPRAQYDHHSQIIFRLRDQDGRPVTGFDIFFDSVKGPQDTSLPMRKLMEDKHVNGVSPNIITFYLRVGAFSKEAGDWVDRVPEVQGCYLEISALEPRTEEILYLPLRLEIGAKALQTWIQWDRTTIVDVELLRVPSPEIFRLVRAVD